MIGLSRRGFVASLAVAPVLGGCARQVAGTEPVLLYDKTLASGRAFAARGAELGLEAVALDGDRVALLRSLLAAQNPASLWGLSRHADQLLVSEIARENGYRPALSVQHLTGAPARLSCREGMATAGMIATLSGGQWPTAFAELAAGQAPLCDHRSQSQPGDPAMSWVLTRNG